MKLDKRILALGCLAAVLVLVSGWLWMSRTQGEDFAQCRKSVMAGGLENLGGPFTLTNQDGQRVTDAQVLDQPSLIYFGYTYCPDVCPLDTARNAETVSLLAERNIKTKPVFISVDPTRDTPEVLKEFAQSISPDLVGLTGSTEEIDAVSKSWRNYYKLNNQDDPEDYLVDHMTNTFLYLPGRGTVEFYGRDVQPEQMADSVACFVNAAS